MAVFVLDKSGKPLMPCTEKRARLLLVRGRARIHRLVPFAVRLVDRRASSCKFQPLEIKLDPGSKGTGIALVRLEEVGGVAVLNLFELMHRGMQISKALSARAALRRGRRSRNLRYRAPRFDNRPKAAGWLAPSLKHRVDTTCAWVDRLRRFAPVTSIAQELVRFDMQAMQNPEISGVEYQQGTLLGYEVREYLLAKLGRSCQYCDAENVPLQIEHIVPKSKGGSNRISNLSLACCPCNTKKSNRPISEFLAKDPARAKKITAAAQAPLRDAAAVNSTRWALYQALRATGLQVATATGGRTKYNRAVLAIPKTHALDAACVGIVPALSGWRKPILSIKCAGRGSYKRTRTDASGFPRGYLMRQKGAFGFRTGDLVKAVVPGGKRAGVHGGRVAIRARGNFNIQTGAGLVTDVSYRHCRLLQRADGYGYSWNPNPGRTNFPVSPATNAAAAPSGSLREPALLVAVPTGEI